LEVTGWVTELVKGASLRHGEKKCPSSGKGTGNLKKNRPEEKGLVIEGVKILKEWKKGAILIKKKNDSCRLKSHEKVYNSIGGERTRV